MKKIIIVFIPIFVISVVVFCYFSFFKDFYVVESRIDNIKKMKKNDKKPYDTVGWIKVQGTNIDMKVINLNHEKPPVEMENYAWNSSDDVEFHNIMNIWGHNVFNLSSSPQMHLDIFQRFEDLMSFTYYDFAIDNKYIQFTLDNKEYLYKIFSVGFIPSYEVDLFPEKSVDRIKMKKHIQYLKDYSIYDYSVNVNENDSVISLITCSRLIDAYQDFVVSGRLVREKEMISDYKVIKNDNYKKVESILKGDDVSEKESDA